MRILLTTDTVGGVWTFTRELSIELMRRGHSVALLSLGGRLSEGQNAWVLAMGRRYKRRFFHLNRPVPLEWMENNDRTFYEGGDAVVEMFDVAPFEIELIHANQFPWASLNIGYPVVTTAHSDALSWAEACEPGGLAPGVWLDRYIELVSEGLEDSDVVAAPSEWMAAALTRGFPCTKPVAVVHNGRDLGSYLQRAPSRTRQLQAVSAARVWDKAKGLQNLDGLTLPMPLLIAGQLDRAGDRSGAPSLPKGAQCLGRIDERKVLDLFCTSSVYLLASIYEPFGLSALEAALCGCAVLARDLPSLREVWGDAAIFFKDIHDLQTQLVRFAAEPDWLAAAQQRSREHAQKYTASRMADGYLELYQRAFDDAEAYCDIDVDFAPWPPERWEDRYER